MCSPRGTGPNVVCPSTGINYTASRENVGSDLPAHSLVAVLAASCPLLGLETASAACPTSGPWSQSPAVCEHTELDSPRPTLLQYPHNNDLLSLLQVQEFS